MKFVSRAEWGARPPRSQSTNIAPTSCTAHYGGDSPWGGVIGSHQRCPAIVRSWQNFHMDGRGWADIAYNMVACPHGYVFQGRGHGVRSAANGTSQGNHSSYAICYLAGAPSDPLTDDGKRAFLDAAKVLGQPLTKVHSDWFATSCPGDEVRRWVRAGAPSPGGATPAPPVQLPPTNVGKESDSMFLHVEGLGLFIVAGDKVAGFQTPAEWEDARRKSPGVPTAYVPKAVGEQLVY